MLLMQQALHQELGFVKTNLGYFGNYFTETKGVDVWKVGDIMFFKQSMEFRSKHHKDFAKQKSPMIRAVCQARDRK